MAKHNDVVIVGAGFTGLTAAYVLAKQGRKVRVVEADSSPGGLAGTFEFADGVKLEKFYHHWFNNDVHVPELVKELGMEGDVILLPTRTGMDFNGRLWKLSTPLDLLRINALPFARRKATSALINLSSRRRFRSSPISLKVARSLRGLRSCGASSISATSAWCSDSITVFPKRIG